MQEIEGYRIIEELYREANSVTYRALSPIDGKKVILKTTANPYPKMAQVSRLKHEFQIGKSLDPKKVVEYKALIYKDQVPVIVMEDFGATSLRKFLGGKPSGVKPFLDMAIGILNSFEALRTAHIIHKDIKPDNILINPETNTIKITDFGISVDIHKQTSVAILNPRRFAGTFYYLSPEQTGRVNRPIDYRTDFYSLGITFYEMLSGVLPFESQDALEVIYAHLAKQAKPLSEVDPAIPPVLSAIVAKLMAKTPEERYQSVNGIKADFEKCRTFLKTSDSIPSFELGNSDFPESLMIPSKLYGRDEQIKTLQEVFKKVKGGMPNAVMVAGYSGIGKTSLVMEARRAVLAENGNFLNGKFDQFVNNQPYSALAQALGKFFESLLTEEESSVQEWKKKLTSSLGENAQLIIDTIPQAEAILGKHKAVLSLSAEESEVRFNLTFKNLIQSLTSSENPLVIFLDDLQWVDVASLNLIYFLLKDPEIRNLMIIGAYRDNEVTPAHPLMEKLRGLNEIKILTSIFLGPLSPEDVLCLVSETFVCNKESAKPLAQLIYKKTEGNPFFLNRFLEKLYEDSLVYYDQSGRGWQWDLAKITSENITDNVVELLLGRIRKLSPGAQEVLKIAASLGAEFELELLAKVTGKSRENTLQDLWENVKAELVFTEEESYAVFHGAGESNINKSGQGEQRSIRFKFIHDRIQQAAYSLLSTSERETLHLKIGHLLLNASGGNPGDEDLFEIVNHLDLGSKGISNPSEKKSLAELNLRAGRKAKASNAISSAAGLFSMGAFLIGNNFKDHYDLAFSLNLERIECDYLSGGHEKPLQELKELLPKAKNRIDKVRIYIILVTLHSKYDDKVAILETAREGMKMLGYSLPASSLGQKVVIMSRLIRTKIKLRNQKKIKDLVNLPLLKDPLKIRELEFMHHLIGELLQSKPEYWVIVNLVMIEIFLKYGQSAESCIALAGWGLLNLTVLNDADAAVLILKEALKIVDNLGSQGIRWKIFHVYYAYINHWKEHGRTNIEFMKDIYAGNLQFGSVLFATAVISAYFWKQTDLGKNLDEIIEGETRYITYFKGIHESEGENYMRSRSQMHFALKGLTQPHWSLDTEDFIEADSMKVLLEKKSFSVIAALHVSKLMLANYSGNDKLSLELAMGYDALYPFIQGLMISAFGTLHASLALIKALENPTIPERRAIQKRLNKYSKQINKWAKDCPENFLHLQLLVAAETARIQHKHEEAEKTFELAISDARKNGFHHNEALANELAGKYFLSRNQEKVARTYLFDARYGYQRWGASLKVQQMDQDFSQLLQGFMSQPQPGTLTATGTTTMATTSSEGDILDLQSVMKASTAISGEIVLEKLLQKLMEIVMENAGARRGIFILKRSAGFFIEAVGSADDGIKVLTGVPIEKSTLLPLGLIRLVERTAKDIVLQDAFQDPQFSSDPYFEEMKKRLQDKKGISVLCTPIQSRSEVKGLLYFENDFSTGTFTKDRVEVLRILSGQIAVSLENSINYENLENKVKERTVEIQRQKDEIENQKGEIEKEKAKADSLLLNILPSEIADELKSKGKASPRKFEHASILFSDIEGFTAMADKLTPEALVGELDELFGAFDQIVEKFGMERIKTIGDAYMAAAGVPTPDPQGPLNTVKAALEMQVYMENRNRSKAGTGSPQIMVRIGIHTGPVVAGVVGTRKFAYDIWGDAVNLASRMESSGAPGKINISGDTYALVKNTIKCTHRGKIAVKNKGEIDMYFVEG